jgi:threonine/homoserine/homoserine lactone efflux protein
MVYDRTGTLMITRPALHHVLREAVAEMPIRLGTRCIGVSGLNPEALPVFVAVPPQFANPA